MLQHKQQQTIHSDHYFRLSMIPTLIRLRQTVITMGTYHTDRID